MRIKFQYGFSDIILILWKQKLFSTIKRIKIQWQSIIFSKMKQYLHLRKRVQKFYIFFLKVSIFYEEQPKLIYKKYWNHITVNNLYQNKSITTFLFHKNKSLSILILIISRFWLEDLSQNGKNNWFQIK